MKDTDYYIPTDREALVLLSKKKKTAHVLHLLLCLITLGLWLPVWVLAVIGNASENNNIDRKLLGKTKKTRYQKQLAAAEDAGMTFQEYARAKRKGLVR